MKISKLSWLGAVVALAAIVGAVAYTPQSAEAAVTATGKACAAAAGPNTATCTLTFTATAPEATTVGTTYTVTIQGPATFSGPVAITGACTPAAAGAPVAAVAGPAAAGTTFTITQTTACPAGATVTYTVTEALTLTGPGPVSQTVTGLAPGGVPSTSAVVATGLPVFAVAAPASITKVCTPTNNLGLPAGTAVVGSPVTCVVTFNTAAVGGPVSVTVTNATFSTATPIVATSGTTGAISPVAGAGTGTVTFTCGAGGVCTGFTETFVPTTAGALPVQTITIGGTAFTVAAGNLTVTGLAAVVGGVGLPVTISSAPGCSLGATFGTAVAGNLFTPGTAGFGLTVGGGLTNLITCRISLQDAGLPAGAPAAGTTNVSSGIVAVTLENVGINGVVVGVSSPGGGPATTVGATTTIRCGAAGNAPAADNSCAFVDVTFAPTGGLIGNNALPFTLGVNVTYTPDLPTNTSAQARFAQLFTIGQGIAALVQPAGLLFTCTGSSATGIAATGIAQPIVGQLGLAQPIATGILPATVSCNVVPVDAAGNRIVVAPGTIEVTSLNGTLLSLSGTLTTNLRIACGDPTLVNLNTFFVGGVINANACSGVTFSVLGQGVGLVELRARYEPIAPSLDEVEGSATVAFVAPAIGVTLALDPNPVAVGATGTATATLTTVFTPTCTGVAIGTTGAVVSSTQCINPATGLPITTASNPGSVLNGIVVFATDNSAIARFVEGGQANAGTTLNLGVTSTASQVVRDCGAFSGGGTVSPFTISSPFVGNLDPFFGGCTTATATYRGVAAGTANISAAFIPFLPGASSLRSSLTGTTTSAIGAGLAAINFFAPGQGPASTFRTLQVADVAPSGNVQLARGCNNVSPTVTESVSAYAARVTPTSAVISIFQYNTATNSFAGAPGPSAPASAQAVADLTTVTRLVPVFVCVSAPATLAQPAI